MLSYISFRNRIAFFLSCFKQNLSSSLARLIAQTRVLDRLALFVRCRRGYKKAHAAALKAERVSLMIMLSCSHDRLENCQALCVAVLQGTPGKKALETLSSEGQFLIFFFEANNSSKSKQRASKGRNIHIILASKFLQSFLNSIPFNERLDNYDCHCRPSLFSVSTDFSQSCFSFFLSPLFSSGLPLEFFIRHTLPSIPFFR